MTKDEIESKFEELEDVLRGYEGAYPGELASELKANASGIIGELIKALREFEVEIDMAIDEARVALAKYADQAKEQKQ